MRMIKQGMAVAALVAGTAAVPAFAQAGGVLTVDMDRLLSDSAAAKSAQTQLQTRYQAQQNQINTELQTSGQALQTQENAARTALAGSQDINKLPPATRTALEQASQRFSAARQSAAQFQQVITDSQNYARDQIIAAVVPLAEAIRAERRAAIVLPRGGALAADPAADVTATLLPRLDAQLKTVAIAPPQQGAAPGATAAPAATGPARPTAPAAGARRQQQGR